MHNISELPKEAAPNLKLNSENDRRRENGCKTHCVSTNIKHSNPVSTRKLDKRNAFKYGK